MTEKKIEIPALQFFFFKFFKKPPLDLLICKIKERELQNSFYHSLPYFYTYSASICILNEGTQMMKYNVLKARRYFVRKIRL